MPFYTRGDVRIRYEEDGSAQCQRWRVQWASCGRRSVGAFAEDQLGLMNHLGSGRTSLQQLPAEAGQGGAVLADSLPAIMIRYPLCS